MTKTDFTLSENFDSYDAEIRACLLEVRQLILKVAARTDGVGPITETLKWGEPSYLTSQTGSGSTIRISTVKNAPDKFGIYFNCQTTLVEEFRQLYPDAFEFNGNRAVICKTKAPLPREPLEHCIALALTYHLRKKRKLVK